MEGVKAAITRSRGFLITDACPRVSHVGDAREVAEGNNGVRRRAGYAECGVLSGCGVICTSAQGYTFVHCISRVKRWEQQCAAVIC